MLTSVAVKNFQSLYDVEIPLSPFTVLVGPSSSGKSAFIRAVRLLLQNARGTAFISHGEETAHVIAMVDNDTVVSLQRGKTNQYELSRVDLNGILQVETFTKLGGEVPEEVENFLGIDPAISIASQFDPPFLLTASGSEVARTLGALTNVEVVHAAARESNRRKLQESATLRLHEEALGSLQEELAARSAGIEDRRSLVEAAEAALAAAEAADAALQEGEALLAAVTGRAAELRAISVPVVPETEELFRAAKRAVEDLQAALALQSLLREKVRLLRSHRIVEVPEVDIPAARAAVEAAREAAALLERLQGIARAYRAAMHEADDLDGLALSLQEDRQRLLQEAGICPTCGQDTEHLDGSAPSRHGGARESDELVVLV